MIASRTHGFIFIKTRKTGSTSLEIVLSAWCSGRDICTPISPDDEILRRRFGGAPCNHRGLFGDARFYNHMPAADIRRKLPFLWRRAFRFAVERHPYEKVVSLAWFQLAQSGRSENDIAAEIDAVITDRLYLNWPLYAPRGRLLVDQVWDYEEAWQRLGALAERLGTLLPTEPPRAKAGFRKDRRPAREILSEEQRAVIRRDARFEFDLMKYQP